MNSAFFNTTSNEHVNAYLRELAMIPTLSPKEEQALLQQIVQHPDSKEANDARSLLIESSLHLVVRIAERYPLAADTFADAIQEGNLALIQAAHQFDPQGRKSFRAFVTQRVTRAIRRVVQQHLREKHVVAYEEELSGSSGAHVLQALAHHAFDEHSLFELTNERFVSLPDVFDERDDDHPLFGHALESEDDSPEEQYLVQEQRYLLESCLQTLTTKECLVLTYRYVAGTARTLEEVGSLLGLSREQVRRIEQRGLQTLRHPRYSCLLSRLL